MSSRQLARVGFAVAVVAMIGLVALLMATRRTPVNDLGPRATVPSAPMVAAQVVEDYAERILNAQKSFYAGHRRYATQLTQLKLGSPSTGVKIDYRGSSPLGFCWLARSNEDVWYTISQRRVNRTAVAVTAPPPISCR